MSALNTQVGGSHYKDLKIQPVEYIHGNSLGYMEGNVVKYVTRWRDKNGIKDLEKAKHYIELLIEMELKEAWIEYDGESKNHPETGMVSVKILSKRSMKTSVFYVDATSIIWEHKKLKENQGAVIAYKLTKDGNA